MRNFFGLDQFEVDDASGIITFSSSVEAPFRPHLSLRKEGSFIALSTSHGPIEAAMRPRLDDLRRVLVSLYAVEGLQTTRQVGTGESYIALGLSTNGSLIIRPTLVADATGHLCFNLMLSTEMRAVFYKWLEVEKPG